MANLTFVLGRVVDGEFHTIEPTCANSDLAYDPNMVIEGMSQMYVRRVMGNTVISVHITEGYVSIVVRGSARPHFDGRYNTMKGASPESKLHKLRIDRGSLQLQLHYYVIHEGDEVPKVPI